MSAEAAKRALAALLLNIPTTPEGAVSVESLFARLVVSVSDADGTAAAIRGAAGI